MINYNGTISDNPLVSITGNRAFLYGDAVFETFKIVDNKILFLEDHYFRLMASMRILRMEIPMSFTMEFMEQQILSLLDVLKISSSARTRLTFFRKDGGKYLPEDNNTEFFITAEPLEKVLYEVSNGDFEVDIYKDFYIPRHLLSTLKTTNKLLHITGSIYASENGLANCFLLNEDKNIVEALQGNIFMLTGDKLVTPPLSDGCLNGIMRKQIIRIIEKMQDIQFEEASISPFDLQKADEIFITNVISGVQPVKKYRKKDYVDNLSKELVKRLNAQIRLV